MLVQLRKPARPTAAPEHRQHAHVFDTGHGAHVLVVDGSRIYTVDPATAAALRASPAEAAALLAELGLLDPGAPAVTDDAPAHLPVRSLSLAVAQKCNLACVYCYAQEGSFGAEPKDMSRDAAMAAIDLLFRDLDAARQSVKERVSLAFLGGEPLVNRALVRECTEYAAGEARRRGVNIAFAITTNGTLLQPDDAAFFERHGFAVTVSLDGVGAVHDQLRPLRGGQGSYERILARVRPLLVAQQRMQVSARVTVTPGSLCLRETLEELLALGFHSVGFSPMLRSPTGRAEMDGVALEQMLVQMLDCGEEALRRTLAGERYAFANLFTAVQQIHRGTHRPYPCGAGGGYFGVSADGELYACHRFVEDPAAHFGDVWSGVATDRQARWLDERHVHRQEPCRSCWARYLCGGGCHHEVLARGRPACDYIRGWLDFCLKSYVRLRAEAPQLFA